MPDATPMQATLVQHQIQLEELFSKNQLIPRIMAEFTECEQFDFRPYFTEKGIPEDFGYALLTQMALHKRCDLPTLIGVLRHHCSNDQQVADLLMKAVDADLVDWSHGLQVFIVKFTIAAEVQEELDRFQFPLPMVVEPKEVKHNKQSGYYLNNSSIILKKNHHEDDVCLDHINRVNRIAFCVNLETAAMVKNQWRNLDRAKEGESKEDFERRKKAFDKYDRTARDVMVKLCQHGNQFYITHRYDKRGRIYAQGYHVNYQGTPWNKAVIEFANKEFIE